MLLWVLTGCFSLGDHCVTTRAANGDVREIAARTVKGNRLLGEAIRQSELGDPVAESTNTYEKGLWVYQGFDTILRDPDLTRETFIEHDAEGRVVSREIFSLLDDTREGLHEYTWDGDRLATTHNETLFTTWDEVWTWNGNTASVEQTFLGGRVIPQIRTFVPSPLDWPLLTVDNDLPGLAFVRIGNDDDADGTISDEERVWEQEVDELGIPSFSRLYDSQGDLSLQVEWGACP